MVLYVWGPGNGPAAIVLLGTALVGTVTLASPIHIDTQHRSSVCVAGGGGILGIIWPLC